MEKTKKAATATKADKVKKAAKKPVKTEETKVAKKVVVKKDEGTVKKTAKPVAKPVKKAKNVKSKGKVVAHGVGRRKRAVARVWLRRGSGKIVVNGKDYKKYFDTDLNVDQAHIPFKIVKVTSYDADINVNGGGVNSQAEAVKLGISRALVEHDSSVRPELKKYHLLTVDSRVKERKKYGQKGARRKFQFVKR